MDNVVIDKKYDSMILEDLCDIIANDVPVEVKEFIIALLRKKVAARKAAQVKEG